MFDKKEDMDYKIHIIKQLTKRHPNYGADKNWSEYHGGMRDSGHWYFEKMLDVPISELKAFLCEILAEENAPPRIYTEKEKLDMNTITYHTSESGVYWSNKYEDDILKDHQRLFERLIFGI